MNLLPCPSTRTLGHARTPEAIYKVSSIQLLTRHSVETSITTPRAQSRFSRHNSQYIPYIRHFFLYNSQFHVKFSWWFGAYNNDIVVLYFIFWACFKIWSNVNRFLIRKKTLNEILYIYCIKWVDIVCPQKFFFVFFIPCAFDRLFCHLQRANDRCYLREGRISPL